MANDKGFYDKPKSPGKTLKKLAVVGGIVLVASLPFEIIKVNALVEKSIVVNKMVADDTMIDNLIYDEITDSYYVTHYESVEMSLGSALSHGHKIESIVKKRP